MMFKTHIDRSNTGEDGVLHLGAHLEHEGVVPRVVLAAADVQLVKEFLDV